MEKPGASGSLLGGNQHLADLIDEGTIAPFPHAVDALLAIAKLLPEMMVKYPGVGYVLENPTVIDENFAERWNDEDGVHRADAFRTWCDLLHRDLETILAQTDPEKIAARTLEVFGCEDGEKPEGGIGNGTSGLGMFPPVPKAAPRTSGLA